MIKVYAYNSGKGDCIRLRFGDGHNIIIDSGVVRFGVKFKAICKYITESNESLDLLVITHMDGDHLGGALWLSRLKGLFPFEKVVINGIGKERANTPLSTKQNSELIRNLNNKGVSIEVAIKDDVFKVDGAVIKILWPTENVIKTVYKTPSFMPLSYHFDYRRSMSDLSQSPLVRKDNSQSNYASIIFSFEYEDKRLLFTGDAWGDSVVINSEEKTFDLIKLPHHGSAANITEDWEKFNCNRYLICTDGISHPDKQTVAKLQKWHGDITIYSPSDWWSKGFLLPEDRSPKFVLTDGQAIGV